MKQQNEQHFFTLAGLKPQEAAQKIAEYQTSEGVAVARYTRTFTDYEGSTSVRSDSNRLDYDRFRPSERIPRTRNEIISACIAAYDRVGIVKNIIDLMGDFTIQGIKLQYRGTKREEAIWQQWWEAVRGANISERLANVFYKAGNVFVYKTMGKVKNAGDLVIEKNIRIPWGYTILNPLSVKVDYQLGKVSYTLGASSQIPFDPREMDNLPSDFRNIKDHKEIPLSEDNLRVFYYKKDDWQYFAHPMIFCIIDDLIMLEKLKLADLSALDGVISNVRLWTLGVLDVANLQNSVLPTRKGLDNLKNILLNHSTGGTMDLVWGPELKFTESQSQAWRFLGTEKYKVTLDSIYDGLGISSVLRSGGNSDSTKNFVSLKTLIERLEYGRRMIIEFWSEEIKQVQRSLGLRYPAEIVFDEMILSDEFAQKRLMIELMDRDVISTESVQEFFRKSPEIEKVRLKRESKKRGGSLPEKASPYHNPLHKHELKKIALTSGVVAPSEVGLELQDRKKGEKSGLEMKVTQDKKYKKVGSPNDGRPTGVVETNKRKPKKDVKTVAKKLTWAVGALSKIDTILTPAILDMYGRKNKRELTNAEQEHFDEIKVGVLYNLEPLCKINIDSVRAVTETPLTFPFNFKEKYNRCVAEYVEENGSDPTYEELKLIRAQIYSIGDEDVQNEHGV